MSIFACNQNKGQGQRSPRKQRSSATVPACVHLLPFPLSGYTVMAPSSLGLITSRLVITMIFQNASRVCHKMSFSAVCGVPQYLQLLKSRDDIGKELVGCNIFDALHCHVISLKSTRIYFL